MCHFSEVPVIPSLRSLGLKSVALNSTFQTQWIKCNRLNYSTEFYTLVCYACLDFQVISGYLGRKRMSFSAVTA